jgi:hypothetical protein
VDANDPSLPPAFEEGPTLREVTWGVATRAELDALRGRFAGQPGHFETTTRWGASTRTAWRFAWKLRASATLDAWLAVERVGPDVARESTVADL